MSHYPQDTCLGADAPFRYLSTIEPMRASTTSFLLALLLITAACSSSTDNGESSDSTTLAEGSDDIATLETEEATDDTAAEGLGIDEAEQTTTPEESSLEFSQCMRDEGIDFPDLGVDASGNIGLDNLPADFNIQDPGVQDAFTACQSILASGGFGEQIRETIESDEFEQALLDFSECIRDQGYDVGDLTLTSLASAAFQAPAPTDDAPQEADREDGFGDRDGIFAIALGLDPDDPEVEAAINECNHIMEGALSGLGLG